jgi:glutaconate CoA-transferase subunit A
VIVIAEEIVAPEVIASDPNRTLIPGFLVTAVVHEPWGAHPSPVQGYYGRDHDFFHEYHDQTRELDGFERWIKHWVAEVSSLPAYLKQLGVSRTDGLRVREHALSVPVDFGF